jgi:hypothetical protein
MSDIGVVKNEKKYVKTALYLDLQGKLVSFL